MRSMLTTLVTTCAVCAAAQTTALAQPADPNAQPPLPPPPPADVAPAVDAPTVTPVTVEATTTTPVSTGYVALDGVDTLSYAWGDPHLASGIGISTSLGGGVAGFTDKTMRNATSDVGGLWDLRVTLGTRLPLAVDLSYIGSATGLKGFSGRRNGNLIGTTVEGAIRWNVLPHAPFTPYIFGGAGWTRYDVTQNNVTLADSGMNPSDNLLEFPAGVGFAWRAYGFTADVRGTYRQTMDQNLVLKSPLGAVTNNSDDFAPMHSWEASAAVGYEF
jgi:hypothetical protein